MFFNTCLQNPIDLITRVLFVYEPEITIDVGLSFCVATLVALVLIVLLCVGEALRYLTRPNTVLDSARELRPLVRGKPTFPDYELRNADEFFRKEEHSWARQREIEETRRRRGM